MDHSIILYFSADAEKQIINLRKEIHSRIDNSHTLLTTIRPHITLTSFLGNIPSNLISSLRNTYELIKPFEICLNKIAAFESPKNVVFIYPENCLKLSLIQTSIYSSASSLISQIDLYDPKDWIPHCTIASRITQIESIDSINYLNTQGISIKSIISKIGIIGGNPVKEICTISI